MYYKLLKCAGATLLPFISLWFLAWVSTLSFISEHAMYGLALAFTLVYSVAGSAFLAIYIVTHTKFD